MMEAKSESKSVQIMRVEGSALKAEFNNKYEIVSVYEISNEAQQRLYAKRIGRTATQMRRSSIYEFLCRSHW